MHAQLATLTHSSFSQLTLCAARTPTCSGESSCLLRFYGFGVNSSGQGYIVTELCERGSLRSVFRNESIELPWSLRIRIALQVCKTCDKTSDATCLRGRWQVYGDGERVVAGRVHICVSRREYERAVILLFFWCVQIFTLSFLPSYFLS
jgi:serine/threonine protein kinase